MSKEVVALIPAAGKGSRLAPIPCSKEIFPVGFENNTNDGSPRPKVVSQYLLEKFKNANITKAFIVTKKGKWDILSYFGDGSSLDMQFAYIPVEETFGHPFSIQKALPFVEGKMVAFGYPDIIFNNEKAFSKLIDHLNNNSKTDVVLGLFQPNNPSKWDMVELIKDKLNNIKFKPEGSTLKYTWLIAVWKPRFSLFINHYLNEYKEKNNLTFPIKRSSEIILDHIFLAAINNGFSIDCVTFNNSNFLDIGTPSDLYLACKQLRLSPAINLAPKTL